MIIDNKSNESNEIRIWILHNFTKWQETSGKTWISYWIPAWLQTGEASLQTLWGCDLILAEAIEDGFVQDLIGTSTAAPWYWQLWLYLDSTWSWHGNSLDVPRLHLVGHRPIADAAVFARAKYEMIRNGMIRLRQSLFEGFCNSPKKTWTSCNFSSVVNPNLKSSPCLGLLRGLVQAFQPGCLSSGSTGENPPIRGWFGANGIGLTQRSLQPSQVWLTNHEPTNQIGWSGWNRRAPLIL